MAKKKKVLITAAVIAVAVIIIAVLVCVLNRPIKWVDDTHFEYNGIEYHKMDGEAKYYSFITDEKLYTDKNLLFPHTYYTLKNDDKNQFIYVTAFRDHILYTSLPISKLEAPLQKDVTGLIIERSASETKKVYYDNADVINAFVNLNVINDISDNFTETFTKNTHNGWYYIYYANDNLPICSIVDYLTIGCYDNRYFLSTEITDNTFTGWEITDKVIIETLNSMNNN